MSIATEITRLQNAKTALKTSINAKTDNEHKITNETIDDYASFVDSIQTGGGGQKNRLPDEYQEVEYIQSSGTQYFTTDYYANGNSQYAFKFSDGSTNGVVFGAYNSGWTSGSGLYHSNSTNQFEWFHYYANTGISNLSGGYTKTYELFIDKGNVYSNGTAVYSSSTKTFTVNYPTYILAGNWVGSRAEQPLSCKLYYFKISENDVLIHNYVPCYRKADDVIGMYDLVDEEFITNAGTGTFTKGADHDTPLINLQDKSETITTNTTTTIKADSNYDGLGTVSVTTNVQPNLESKSITITENTTTTITPTSGKDGISSLIVTTNVAGGGADLTQYFNTEITSSNYSYFGRDNLVKKAPTITVNSNCTSLENAFYGASMSSLKIVCNHTNLTNISSCFYYMRNLSSLDLSEFNCTNVTNMSKAFSSNNLIENIDLSGINAKSVTNMSQMFQTSYNLKTVDFTNFDTSNVTNMSYMFSISTAGDMGFKTLDLSMFDTSKVTNMNSMFKQCAYLETLDISNFDFTTVTNYTRIFNTCGTKTTTGLTNVYVKDATAQSWILNLSSTDRPSTWTTANVIIAGSSDDLRNN